MADSKISALPASTVPLGGTEVLPIVQSSATKQVSVANLTAGRSVSVADLAVSTGNIVPGTAAKGINFTANTPAAGMTSRLLNWYEEGTWTPTDGSGAGLIITVTSASYTRIGRLVTLVGDITYPITASATAASISGLPFNSAATGGGLTVHFTGYTSKYSGVCSGASIALYGLSGGGSGAMTNVSLSAVRTIFTVTYRI